MVMLAMVRCVQVEKMNTEDVSKLATAPKRFFQMSHDLTTLRWSWKQYVHMDEIVSMDTMDRPGEGIIRIIRGSGIAQTSTLLMFEPKEVLGLI